MHALTRGEAAALIVATTLAVWAIVIYTGATW